MLCLSRHYENESKQQYLVHYLHYFVIDLLVLLKHHKIIKNSFTYLQDALFLVDATAVDAPENIVFVCVLQYC